MYPIQKRVRSLGLALTLVASLLALPSYAFTDKADILHVETVEEMVQRNIFTGMDEKSTFYPTQPVTRAEMVKMTVLILNGGRDPRLESTATPEAPLQIPFPDLEGSPYTNYVLYAFDLGLVAGTDNGDFGPEDIVTGAQGAKMLLVAMGYDPEAEGFIHSQDWATNVATCAQEAGLFHGLEEDIAHRFLSRDSVALLMQNAISAPLVRYEYQHTAADGGPATVRMERDGKTLLSQAFGQ